MRLTALALAFMLTLGASRLLFAKNPPLILWTLWVTDSSGEAHEHAFQRTGAKIKLDVQDIKCSYSFLEPEKGSVYIETAAVRCVQGTFSAGTLINCGSKARTGYQTGILLVGAGKENIQIKVACDPQD